MNIKKRKKQVILYRLCKKFIKENNLTKQDKVTKIKSEKSIKLIEEICAAIGYFRPKIEF